VYTKNLIAHRGTDNQILIEFVNQDQKRVDLRDKDIASATTAAGSFIIGQDYEISALGDTDFSLVGAPRTFRVGTIFTATATGTGTGTASLVSYTDLEFTCRLISHDGTELLLEKPLELVNITAGQTKLVLTEQELDSIAPGTIGFSVEQTADGILYEPVFVDDASGGRGNIDVVDSILPSFVDSSTLTIPNISLSPYVSSILNTPDTDLITFQLTMAQFSGEVLIEGAADTDNAWYTIDTISVTESDMLNTNVEGFHPYIRFTFTEATFIDAVDLTVGNEYTITTPGTTDFTLIGAADNIAGTVFTATAAGTGDGTATPTDPDFPGTITEIRYR
jgi:hypothetical protein